MKRRITSKIQRLYWITILMIAMVFGTMLFCKSPFATRDPEEPEQQSRTNWIQPTNARDVLTNLRHAIRDKNLTNYMQCFTNNPENGRSFGFRPDNNAKIRYPGIWSDWSLEHEQTYITNVFHAIPRDSIISLIYLGEGVENPQPDSTIIIREYELQVSHNRNADQFPRKAKGQAEFHLSLNEKGYWAIYYWIDDGFEETFSWSDVKATFIQ